MKKFFNEFKEFISRGNVVDMAVGIMVGAAFKAIVDSLVNDIISPVLGLVLNQNFNTLTVSFWGVTVKYGSFLMAILNFLIIAFILFMLIKGINIIHNLGKKKEEVKEEPAAPTTKVCPFCKTEINIEATRCPHCTSELTE